VRPSLAWGKVLPVVAALLALVAWLAAAPAAAETTVSLSFDDGIADQMAAKQILADHGLHGTFFIIASQVGGGSNYMTWGDIASIYADGNEIGGHTLTHRDLTTLSPDEQRAEICDARQELLARGFPQLSFAYPSGHHDSISEGLVQACGYLSGRASGGLAQSPAESIPPVNRWAIRTRNSVEAGDTVSSVEGSVLQAEAVGGGWLNIVFHDVCDPDTDPDCSSRFRITPADLDAFLGWLASRQPLGTRVETIGEVMLANPEPLLSIRSVRSRRNGTAKLRAFVGRSGLLRVADVAAAGASVAKRKPELRTVSLHAAHAGIVTVTLRASSTGEGRLTRKGWLEVLAGATFTPFPGSSISQTVKVKLRRSERVAGRLPRRGRSRSRRRSARR
jgi:peptidoglycan/xylan/chitin deacetylase (PgdA/CDA1 family)